MVKDNLITEWRKQRKAIVSQSDVGLRPLYDSTINSEEYQPSVECGKLHRYHRLFYISFLLLLNFKF